MKLLKFKKVDAKAILPSRKSEFAAGLDLYSVDKSLIRSGEYIGIRTGLVVAIPHGHYGRIAPRSGLALKQGIDVFAGVIDSDYRGEIVCVLANFGNKDLVVEIGDRIAQLIIEKIAFLEPVWSIELDATTRDKGGFGSTER